MSRFTAVAALATALLVASATPAVAQPYVYAITGPNVFRGGIHLTQLPARLVTIDSAAGQAIASLTLTGCINATGVATRTDGLRVYVSCRAGVDGGALLVIDPVAKQILATRTFTHVAGGVAVSPAGDRLVVPLVLGSAEVLDAASLATLGTIAGTGTVFGDQHPAIISKDASTAYLTESLELSGRLVVANLAGFTITKTIDFSTDNVTDIALTSVGSRLVVGH